MKAFVYARLTECHCHGPRVCLISFFLLLHGCGTIPMSGVQEKVLSAKNAVEPALVHIRPVKEVFAQGQRHEVLAVGSGFIFSPDGYVVTNEHVAGESSQVLCVLSDNTEMEAKVVGTDPDTDIAVLKLEPGGALSSVKLGKSSALESGQMVLAMGSPHGLARSVSLGIVSVTNRYLGDSTGAVGQYNNWIQTDAAINRGNSGGPLVNLEGEVVGINTLTLMGAENLGFAIPMDSAREVIDAIIKDGRVRRSSLGLRLQEMKAKTDNPSLQGVVIADVVPLSSGQEADIRPGDVLTAVNGKPVNARFEEDLSSVRKTIADLPVGEKTVLTLLRGDEQLEVAAVTEEQFSSKGMQAEFLEWGFTVAELTPELARRAQLAGKTGVLVSGCLPGAVASVSGLTPGDIILELDKTAIVSLSQFSQLYAACVEQKKDLVMLFVQRGALTRYVLINSKGISETTIDKEILEHAE